MENYTTKSDQELRLIAEAIKAEQQRREAGPPENKPDPEIREILRRRQHELYGNPVQAWYDGKEAR